MIRLSNILIILCISQLMMAGCSKDSQERHAVPDSSQLIVSSESNVLSTLDNFHALPDKPGSHMPQDDVVFSQNGRGVAYIADTSPNQYVVHNDKAGSIVGEISNLAISPDGRRVSYRKKLGDFWVMFSDGVASKPYKFAFTPVYSPDSRHVAFLATGIDDMTYIMLDGKPVDSYVNVVSAGFLFSHDSGILVYHVRPENTEKANLVMYNLKTGTKIKKDCLDTEIIMNEQKNHLAAVVSINGMQAVIDYSVASPDKVRQSATYDLIKHISLSRDGKSVAFIAGKNGKIYLVSRGQEYLLPDNYSITRAPILSDDGAVASVVLELDNGEGHRSYLLYQTGQRFDDKRFLSAIREPVYSSTGTLAYVAAEGDTYFIVFNGKRGPVFDSVVAPMFSPDGRKLVYRARDGAKRLVVVVNSDGSKHVRLPSYDMVFQIGFTDDGKSIGYGVKESNKLIWKVDKL